MRSATALSLSLPGLILSASGPAPQLAPAPRMPGLRQVVLQVGRIPTQGEVAIRTSSVDQAVRTLLTQAGVKVVKAEGADPSITRRLGIDLLSREMAGGVHLNVIRVNCWRLDQTEAEWTTMHFLGAASVEGLRGGIARNLRLAIEDLVPVPPPREPPPRKALSVRVHEFQYDDRAWVEDFEFDSAKVLKRPPPPQYPEAARAAGIQGDVEVEIGIDASGMPVTAHVLVGPPELAMAAIPFALAFVFEPSRTNGEARPSRFRLRVPFHLK